MSSGKSGRLRACDKLVNVAVPHLHTPENADGARLTLETCYRLYKEQVFRLGLRYGGGDASWAEDLTHDVFIRLLEHLPHLERLDDIGGWLYRVTSNLALSRLRRRRSLRMALRKLWYGSANEAAVSTDLLLMQREQATRAMAILRALPPRERVVLCMKLLDGKSQREIAEALSMSEGFVSKLVARACAHIRALGWEVSDGEA